MGVDAGLPPGPDLAFVELDSGDDPYRLVWTHAGHVDADFWRSRWRDLTASALWTLSASAAGATVAGEFQYAPFSSVSGHTVQWEVAYCDVAGNLKSQWSAFGSFEVP